MTEDEIARIVVDSAIAVHREIGPGLLETVYEALLAHELRTRGLAVERQVPVRLVYRGLTFDEGFRLDLRVADKVIVEVKSIENLHATHKKQLLTYLRLTGCKVGLVLNFGESLMKRGIYRIANGATERD